MTVANDKEENNRDDKARQLGYLETIQGKSQIQHFYQDKTVIHIEGIYFGSSSLDGDSALTLDFENHLTI